MTQSQRRAHEASKVLRENHSPHHPTKKTLGPCMACQAAKTLALGRQKIEAERPLQNFEVQEILGETRSNHRTAPLDDN